VNTRGVEPARRFVEDEQLRVPSRAPARESRWRMPSEYVPTRRSAARASSTSSRTSSTRPGGISASARRDIRLGRERERAQVAAPGAPGVKVARLEHRTDPPRRLVELRDQAGHAGERLEAVLEAYALISHESHGHNDGALATLLHRGEQVARAQQELRAMIQDLLTEGAEAGEVRDDVAADELANYCLHALEGASSVPSKAAVRRLVTVTLAGLRPGA
jgi:hypothetical protein